MTRIAFVTGASRGIGAAAALALAGRGFLPVLAVRDPDAAQSAQDILARLGSGCRLQACDVSDPDSVRIAIATTLDEFGRLDAVINNAGQIDPIGRITDSDPAAWLRAIQVNLVGAYLVLRESLPALLRSQGAVINLSSGAAHTPREGWSAYCASKAGLAMLTRSVAHEYGGGVSAYGLQPGLVDTGMQSRIRGSGMNEISRIPRGQLDPPERSAAIIAWLADRRPAHLVGEDFSIKDQRLLDALAADGQT